MLPHECEMTESKVPFETADRRQWLKHVLRNATLGGIGLVVTYLIGRQVSNGCPKLTSHCGSCQLLANCTLPPARSAREPNSHEPNSRSPELGRERV